MRLAPRRALAFCATVLACVCLGIGFVTSRFGALAIVFDEPASARFAWTGAAVLAGAIVVCLLLAVDAPLGARARAAIAILAVAGTGACLAYAQLIAPFVALVAWFAFAYWREARAGR
jgi:hypothetical protein